MDITAQTALELGRKIKAKELSAPEVMEAFLAKAESMEERVHSFVTLDREGAMERAKKAQKAIGAGTLQGPLAGVPVALKDNLCTEGMATT